jgi:serine protease Do
MHIARQRLVTPWALVGAAGLGVALVAGCTGGGGRAKAGGDASAEASEGLPASIASARDRVFPALVNIRATTLQYWGGKDVKSGSNGSGTIIAPQGHIVTNHHVIADGIKFRVTLADKTEVEADLVGQDPLTDLAVLKIRTSELPSGTVLATASWGDSDALAVGETVIAMGSPFSLSRSVTIGVVSNTERVFYDTWTDDKDLEPDEIGGETTGIFTRWLQHDALINPGNSGGPLVNVRGEIVGINTRGGSGMGFASPASLARDVTQRLIDGGEVVRSTIGLALKPIERTGIDRGVLVNSVTDNPPGPAALAGLKPGDVITAIDGQPLTVRFVEQIPPLLRAIADRPVGSAVAVEYVRNGQVSTAQVVTERLLRDRGEESNLRAWGLSVMQITPRMARERRLMVRTERPAGEAGLGVVITGSRGGSPSATAEPPLQGGDVLISIDGKAVWNVKDLLEQYRSIMAPGQGGDVNAIPETLLVRFDRNGKDQVTILKPRPVPKSDPTPELPKAWIGVSVQPVLRELARGLGIEGTTGFRVTRVYPRTVAATTELRVGDIITGVNGERLAPRTLQDAGMFARRVRQMKIDEPATLAVLRDGKPAEVRLTLERTRIGPDEARKDENRDFELSVREVTFFDRDDEGWDDTVQGVLVEGAEPAGWAGQGGLSRGDLIQKIDGRLVTDIISYRAAMDDVAKRQPARVVFEVLRGVNTSFKFVEPQWKPAVLGGQGR